MQVDMVARDMEVEVKLVRLYKCKTCGVRMFERDTRGHLERHSLSGINGATLSYFTRGKKADTPSRPGHAAIGFKKAAKGEIAQKKATR